MKLSTKARYGLRAMIDIAENQKGGNVLFVKDIAKRQGISEKYLEHIMIALKAAGLVRSVRGSKGGYALTKGPEQIRVNEILRVFEGSFSLVDCIDNPNLCNRYNFCLVKDLWLEIKNSINSILERKTLNDLIQKKYRDYIGENI